MIESAPFTPPLIPPQFGIPGPYRPRMRVPVSLPVWNLRDEDERNINVRFLATGAHVTPSEREISVIAANGSASADTLAIIDDASDGDRVEVWAEIMLPDRPTLVTARAIARISAYARLELDAWTDDLQTTVVVKNTGHTAATFTLCLDGVTATPYGWTQDATTAIGPAEEISADASRTFALDTFASSVAALTTTGERSFTRVRRRTSNLPAISPQALALHFPPEGVRAGDILYLTLPISATGPAIENVSIGLALPKDLSLITGSLAIDDVRVLPRDVTSTENGCRVSVGRVERDAHLRCALLSQISRRDPREEFAVQATIQAPTLIDQTLDAPFSLDRRPAFASTQTYLGDLEDRRDGTYAVRALITNPDAEPLERVRVRWSIAGLLPIDAIDSNGSAIVLQPGTYGGQPCLITDLGMVAPHARHEITLALEPLLDYDAERRIAVAATLLVDTTQINLGTAQRDIAAEPELHTSQLACQHTSLRTGIPRRVELRIANTGASAAHDVRLALDLPDGAIIDGLRPPQPGSRWHHLCDLLPPGSSVTTSLLLSLQRTPTASSIAIVPVIDAANAAPIALNALTLETPSAPLLQSPEITLEPLESGSLLATARIANIGDGPAHDVVVRVPEQALADILPGSTAIDGIQQSDTVGTRSALLAGLRLGILPPDAYRTITWIVVPRDSRPFTACLVLEAVTAERAPLDRLVGYSQSRAASVQTLLATALPDARQLHDDVAQRAPARSHARAYVVDSEMAIGPDETVALASADQSHTSDAAFASDVNSAAPDESATPLVAETNGSSEQPEIIAVVQPDTNGADEGSTKPDRADAIDVEGHEVSPSEELATAPDETLGTNALDDNASIVDLEAGARPRHVTFLRTLLKRGDAGYLQHVLAMRLFVADSIPSLSDEGNARVAEIHEAADAVIDRLRRLSFQEHPQANWLFVSNAFDEQIIPVLTALLPELHPDESFPLVTHANLNAMLPLLHANAIARRGKRTHDLLAAYSEEAGSIFLNGSNEDEPLDILDSHSDALDKALEDLLEAAVTS